MPQLNKFNPLNEIRKGPNDFKDAKGIAEMMIDPDKKGDTDHWRRAAISLLVCTILHTLYARKDNTLTGVVNLLSDPKRPIYEVLDSMLLTEHDPKGEYNWEDPITKEPTKTHPFVASIAKEFKRKKFEELSGILSTVLAYLNLYREPARWDYPKDNDSIVDITVKKNDLQTLHLSAMNSNLQNEPTWVGNVIKNYLNGKDMDLPDGLYICGTIK